MCETVRSRRAKSALGFSPRGPKEEEEEEGPVNESFSRLFPPFPIKIHSGSALFAASPTPSGRNAHTLAAPKKEGVLPHPPSSLAPGQPNGLNDVSSSSPRIPDADENILPTWCLNQIDTARSNIV